MLQTIVEYDIENLDVEQLNRLAETLAPLCARLFSVDKWQIEPDEFGFKFDKIERPSRSTHNVVVRIMLHNFKARLDTTLMDACQIKNQVIVVLRSYGHPEGTTVGVALSYMPIEWNEGLISY